MSTDAAVIIRAKEIVAYLSTKEKIHLITSDNTTDSILRIIQKGLEDQATCFPVPVLRGATFDVKLEEQIGMAVGREVRACHEEFSGVVTEHAPSQYVWDSEEHYYSKEAYLQNKMHRAFTKGINAKNIKLREGPEKYADREYRSRIRLKVEAGELTEKEIDDLALSILIESFIIEKNSRLLKTDKIIGSKTHRNLAKSAAIEGITLLKNENAMLPLERNSDKPILVLGEMGHTKLTDVNAEEYYEKGKFITLFQGIANADKKTRVIYYSGDNVLHAQELAGKSRHIILAIHSTDKEPLSEHYHDLMTSINKVNQNVAVVLFTNNCISIKDWLDKARAIILAYFPGGEGAVALSEIIFGDENPSGKIPFPLNPYPFGYGLSYTTFQISDEYFEMSLDGMITATCWIENTGNCAGEEVVQLYSKAVSSETLILIQFCRIKLMRQERKQIVLNISLSELDKLDLIKKDAVSLYLGTSSNMHNLLSGTVNF